MSDTSRAVELYGGRERGVMIRESDPETGVTVVHARRTDFLDTWLDKGLITDDQHSTARDFQRQFRAAGFGPRYPSVLNSIANTQGRAHSGGENVTRIADAEMWVNLALGALGPQQKSVVIDVLGYERSFREYVLSQAWNNRPARVDTAVGWLQAALETMAATMRRGAQKPDRPATIGGGRKP